MTNEELQKLRRGTGKAVSVLLQRNPGLIVTGHRSRGLIPKDTHSECVASTFYDEDSEVLTIEFVERGTYEYQDFPFDAWREFNNTGSRGTYFNANIRNAGYDYERVA